MSGIVEQFSRFGAPRLAAMLAVTLALVGFFAFVMLRMSQPTMGVLFSDLNSSDVSAILKDLDTRGVKYELRGDGQTILVDKTVVPRLRLDLASKGIPAGGGVGYEIFDKGDAFSSTSFVQNINHMRALEGELSRTIRSISRVQAARVHLVIPEKRLFERAREPPRASIALKLAGELDAAQVRAIRHLVSSAVDGLRPERVSIVDERGRLLADGAQSENGAAGLGIEERQVGIERRLKLQIEDIVASIVGHGRAELPLLSDEYGALTMVLLRLLAFKPADAAGVPARSGGDQPRGAPGDQPEKKTLIEARPAAPAPAVTALPLAAQPRPAPVSSPVVAPLQMPAAARTAVPAASAPPGQVLPVVAPAAARPVPRAASADGPNRHQVVGVPVRVQAESPREAARPPAAGRAAACIAGVTSPAPALLRRGRRCAAASPGRVVHAPPAARRQAAQRR